jgi:hypothetical protein
MDGLETNMKPGNSSYGIDGHVNNNNKDNNWVILKIKLPFGESVILAVSILLLLLNHMFQGNMKVTGIISLFKVTLLSKVLASPIFLMQKIRIFSACITLCLQLYLCGYYV